MRLCRLSNLCYDRLPFEEVQGAEKASPIQCSVLFLIHDGNTLFEFDSC